MAADHGLWVDAEIAGESMQLLAARALFWPRERRLFLSDLHLGKGDVFRRAGIGLPRGGTASDLGRLADAVALTGATSVWILGDVLHGAVHDSAWLRDWAAWYAAHAQVDVAALTGNHDRVLAQAGLDVELLGEAFDIGPFALRHEPVEVDGLHVLSGHLHPCIGIAELGARRWPAFWLQPRTTVLPAFSEFTGGCQVEASRADGIVVCAAGTAAWVQRRAAESAASRRRAKG
ncbi:ligase-associated DNA damage response endonuclease PdeM [Lysobacter sp. TY2-98]|uniref:ligase-associated DNA damage response endonuclease PdeM n=1 Tax=Lysobacter sp. TY2-98 TaxID=2290922 RepID=UPI000E204693|nr:ligase-associated DNA damage response endonuclease PdeM [Lysobacter sp. TY2-98]AXK71833.1 ligase-associated DNA damage response endonuclease PdeM [Lysobacter sp. TY2-98]